MTLHIMSDTIKKVVFADTVNKYKHSFTYTSKIKSSAMTDKATGVKSTDALFHPRYYTYPMQLDILTGIYKYLNENIPFPIQLDIICEQVLRHIQTKISGYKMQDKIKKRTIDVDFVDAVGITRMLRECKCGCHYCKHDVFVLYKNTQEMRQWTLDRIDNSVAHSANNVVISCLECNLKKGRKDEDAFIFTKQLAVTKCESREIRDITQRDKLYHDNCDINSAEINSVMSISDIEYSQDS